jgi:hypothetical protein
VIEAEAGDSTYRRSLDYICSVQPSAQSYFQDARIGRGFGEREKRDCRIHFEQARAEFFIGIEHAFHELGKIAVVD